MCGAQDRYLAEIAEACEGMLGPGIELISVEQEDRDDAVRLLARYRLADRVLESAEHGRRYVWAVPGVRWRATLSAA